MKHLIAAIIAAAAPLVLLGCVGGFETGRLPFWGLLIAAAVCIYAEWWGLSAMDEKKEDI